MIACCIQHLNKELFRTFVASIDLKHHQEWSLPLPVDILNYYVATAIFRWFAANTNRLVDHELYYYFDQGKPFLGRFQKLVRRNQNSSRIVNAWHMVRNPRPADMRLTPQLQLADLLAWAHHRRYTKEPEDKWWSVFKFTDAVLPFTQAHIGAEELDKIFLKHPPSIVKEILHDR